MAALALGTLLAGASAQHAQAAFATTRFDYEVTSYQSTLRDLAKTLTKPTAQLRRDLATTEAAGNVRNTAVVVEQVLARAPEDADLWRHLAELLLVADPLNDEDGYTLPDKALGAAIQAYHLAKGADAQAATLGLLAQALAKKDEWRPALTAWKASLALRDDADTAKAYEDAKEQHGFRITDYTVESEAATPRVCFQFSDPLDPAQADFAPYFTQDPGPVSAVTVEGTKLCVEGLKHGASYHLVARHGLPSGVEDVLDKDFTYDVYVRDRQPGVRFAGKSYVLPRVGQNGIPLTSVNSRGAKLTVYRVGDRSLLSAVVDSTFLQQLSSYSASDLGRSKGVKVWEGTLETASPLNEDVTTAFPVDEALGTLKPGLYAVTAQATELAADSDSNLSTQWFVVSDLGVSTLKGGDGLHVSLRSIASAAPLAGVTVRLIARSNEVLSTLQTGPNGEAVFPAGLTKGEDGLQPAMLVASTADDYGFLDLTGSAYDLTDRGVSGRAAPGPMDAFVYAERGVYRRGETVHAAALLRDNRARAVAGVPLTLVVYRPDGVEYTRTVSQDGGAGARAMEVALGSAVPGGTWTIKAFTDPKAEPVGDTSFLVEDYVPNRIEFDLATLDPVATVEAGAHLGIDGRYLFGAPGANLDLEGEVSVSSDTQPFEAWKAYSFGLQDETVDTVQNTLSNLPQTDAKGHADLHVALPDLPTTTHPLKADVTIRMREPGGRAVEQRTSLPVRSAKVMLALKAGFESDGLADGAAAPFSVVAVDPAGAAVAARGVAWTLKKINTTYQWYNADGSWNFEPVTTASKLADGTLDVAAGGSPLTSRTLNWGSYRLEVDAPGLQPASLDFQVGDYTAVKADTPDMLPVALDRTSAKTGDTLQVKIDTRFAGKASVQVVSDRVLSSQLVDVPAGGLTVPVTVGPDWGTGAYVVVEHFRPLDAAARRMPSRAIGLAWFGIDRDQRTLQVSMSPPATMKPRGALTVPIKLANATGGQAYVTVAAVDVGILDLTGYTPPDPADHYFGQTQLQAELRDLYGQLIDGMGGTRGRIRTGGDGGDDLGNANPPAQAPLALFSGIVPVKPDGTAEVSFDIPAFNGTVRLMAVAWTADAVGHASTDVIVRDPVVIAGTLPRFLSDGDTSRFRLDLLNAEAPEGDYTLAVSVDGPITAEPSSLYQSVHLGAVGGHTPVNIPITAHGIGTAHLVATLAGPGGVSIDQAYNLGVEPANPVETRRTVQEIAGHGGIEVSRDLLADMVPGTGRVTLSVGPLPDLDVAGLLQALDRYPFGCSEQLVSRALPLLYLSDLGGEAVDPDGGIKARIEDAVQRVLVRQSSSGAFGLWEADDQADLWLSAYVTDFLLRAREKGYTVPETALTNAVDYLRNQVGNAPKVEQGKGEDLAYALYTLARAGKAPAGDLKYFADSSIADFGTALARAQVGAALGLLGDRPRADEAFSSAAAALQQAAEKSTDRPSRADYGSVLRDAAAIIALAGDTGGDASVIRTAADVVAEENTRTAGLTIHASTQEMTWMVLAARSVQGQAKAIRLTANGEPVQGALYKRFAPGELDAPYAVSNPGGQALRAVVSVTGSPVQPEPAAQNGLTLTRAFFTQDGKPVDPSTVKQNTRLVVVLTAASADTDTEGHFLLVDRLPAGLEIENPALVGSGSATALPWLSDASSATHTEFRDDRFVASFTDLSNGSVKLAYMVRAVAPGRYVAPGATLEDMYRPYRNARTDPGTVTVAAP